MADTKFSFQIRSLKETFPHWSPDDLHSLLLEVNGDVNLAAGRISDGHAVQWDSVSRKKDKKTAAAQPPSKEFTPSRGESRGARGGRGGRGGPGRGGATARGRGAHRGPAVNGHVGRTASPRPAADHSAPTSAQSAHVDPTESSKSDLTAHQNGIIQTQDAWTDPKPDESSNANKKTEAEVNAAGANANVTLPKQTLKTPAPARELTKLSWAQVASKPTHKPAPPQPQPSQQSPTTAPATVHPPPQEPEPEPQAPGWEDPTTAPSWEPEPSQLPMTGLPVEEPQPEPLAAETTAEKLEDPPKPPVPVQAPIPEPMPAKVDPSVAPLLPTPALVSSAAATPSPKLASRSAVASSRANARNRTTDQPVVMPSSFGSGVEKVGMQFGSLSLNGESLFESTPVEPEAPASAVSVAPEPAAATITPNKPQYEASTPAAPPATAPAVSTSLGSVFQSQQQQTQQNLPTQPQHQPSVGTSAISHQTLTTSVSQPTQSTQQTNHISTAATSPLQQFSHQQPATSQPPSLVNLQQTQQQQQQQQQQNHHQLPQHQHLPQQLQQSHTHHQYSQHLPAQLDSQQHLPSTTQQPPTATTHSSYFRQNDTANAMPYFHTPTPPAGQSQESPYGAFSQSASQNQHQQGSHLAGFNSADYNYDNQRGFYESYPQQTGFGNRNVLGHDDNIKGLPGSQQQPPTNSMPPSANQVSQHSSQTAAQPQSAGGQGPQFPPPPVPYYYNPYPQNQYYGTPYSSGYVPQPYVKYPTMFQPGPPGSNSAPSPATKQPGGNVNVGVQPQSNPYSQSLYGQQGAYDDYQQHAHHSQHQHPHALGLGQTNVGVGATDYSKQLYGGGGQGFIGLGGQSGGAGSGVAGTGPRNASSPETAYKYQKDGGIGVGGGRGGSVQGGPGQGQPQGQGAGQGGQGGPQGQGYYGANRFSGGVGTGIGSGVGPQQNAHHQQGGPQGHLAYPQGANDGNFYPYQRQQYWQ